MHHESHHTHVQHPISTNNDSTPLTIPTTLYFRTFSVTASAAAKNGSSSSSGQYDYDLVIIGCGVGGHGAALHAVESVRFSVAYSIMLIIL